MSQTGRIEVRWHECRQADVPDDSRWLTENESRILCSFRVPKRRGDWRLGRWTAKRAVAAYLQLPQELPSLAKIEIRAVDSGAPEVFLPGGPAAVSISITHSHGIAACAVTRPGAALGCDLETIEPRSDAFVADYFTDGEKALMADFSAADHPWLSNLIWSAKESALKALREGLRLDTRSLEVRLQDGAAGEWGPFTVFAGDEWALHGWWRRDQDVVRTLVADPAPGLPLVDGLLLGQVRPVPPPAAQRLE